MTHIIEDISEKLTSLEPRLITLPALARTAALAELAGRLRQWQEASPAYAAERICELRGLFGRIGRCVALYRCYWVVALHRGATLDWGVYATGMSILALGHALVMPAGAIFWHEHLRGLESAGDDALQRSMRPWLQEAARVVPDHPALERLSRRLGAVLSRRAEMGRAAIESAVKAERERCANIAAANGAHEVAELMRCA